MEALGFNGEENGEHVSSIESVHPTAGEMNVGVSQGDGRIVEVKEYSRIRLERVRETWGSPHRDGRGRDVEVGTYC